MPNLTESEFEVRYHLFKETIYNVAYTYVRNRMDAEDITQEVFLKFLKYDGDFTFAFDNVAHHLWNFQFHLFYRFAIVNDIDGDIRVNKS